MKLNSREKLTKTATPRGPLPSEAAVFVQPEIEEGEELIFDFERDVTPHFDAMKAKMESYRELQPVDWANFSVHADGLLKLFPDCREQLGLDEEAFQGIKDVMNSFRRSLNRDWNAFGYRAEIIVRLFPGRRPELGFDEEVYNGINHELRSSPRLSWDGVARYTKRFNLLFPNQRKDVDFIAPELKDKIRADLNPQDLNDYGFIIDVGLFCQLFPDRREELKLGPQDLKIIAENLDFCSEQEPHWEGFCSCAYTLMLLTAQKLELDADGKLVITPPPKRLAKSVQPIPDRLAK